MVTKAEAEAFVRQIKLAEARAMLKIKARAMQLQRNKGLRETMEAEIAKQLGTTKAGAKHG